MNNEENTTAETYARHLKESGQTVESLQKQGYLREQVNHYYTRSDDEEGFAYIIFKDLSVLKVDGDILCVYSGRTIGDIIVSFIHGNPDAFDLEYERVMQ